MIAKGGERGEPPRVSYDSTQWLRVQTQGLCPPPPPLKEKKKKKKRELESGSQFLQAASHSLISNVFCHLFDLGLF